MASSLELSHLRQEYSKHELDEKGVHSSPLEQFKIWFKEALNSGVLEPNAFTFSTIGLDEFPTGRVLLLKELEATGFVFYTNYASDKGKELKKNPVGAMTFLWLELQRQVRIKGTVEKISREQSQEYFQTRPVESQLGAWASPQSTVISNRKILDDEYEKLTLKYKGQDSLPLPDDWGGYRLIPTEIEFWQGRLGRLHDRIRYRFISGGWQIQRLAP